MMKVVGKNDWSILQRPVIVAMLAPNDFMVQMQPALSLKTCWNVGMGQNPGT